MQQLRLQNALSDKLARSVEILEEQVEQFGTLCKPALQAGPAVTLEQMGYEIESPWTRRSAPFPVEVVGDIVFPHLPPGFIATLAQLFGAHLPQGFHEIAPVRTYLSRGVIHFIVMPHRGIVSAKRLDGAFGDV